VVGETLGDFDGWPVGSDVGLIVGLLVGEGLGAMVVLGEPVEELLDESVDPHTFLK
jgi:hypothetical protein